MNWRVIYEVAASAYGTAIDTVLSNVMCFSKETDVVSLEEEAVVKIE